jgi:hypothetical protein
LGELIAGDFLSALEVGHALFEADVEGVLILGQPILFVRELAQRTLDDLGGVAVDAGVSSRRRRFRSGL